MKNSIKTLGTLAIALITLFGCKKTDDDVKVVEEKYSISTNIQYGREKSELAIVIGTKAELEKYLSGEDEAIILKKVATNYNVFEQTGVLNPKEPVVSDDVEECWESINAQYQAGLPTWRAQANATCMPVYQCLTCPNTGLFVLYVIQPTSIKCTRLTATEVVHQLAIEYPYTDNNSTAVAEHINSNKK